MKNYNLPEKTFDEPWQAKAFAVVVNLHNKGAFGWDEWADTLAKELKGGEQDYYKCWVNALTKIVNQKNIVSEEMVEERVRVIKNAAKNTPHGEPIKWENF